jgi:membrane protein
MEAVAHLIEDRGKLMNWKPENLSYKEFGKRVWNQVNEDDLFGRSAQLAYYFFFALFPALIFVTSLIGLVAHGGLQQNLIQWFGRTLPPDAASLVQRTFQHVVQSSGGGKMSFGVIVSLWSAASGTLAAIGALNVAYEVKESRGFVNLRCTALWLTIAVAALFVAAVVIVLYGNTIVNLVGNALHLGPVLAWAWKIAQWPVALAFVLGGFALLYYAGPDLREPKWHWITPGAVLGLALWLVISFAFRVYLHFFNTYNKTYGALGAVMILLLWFYITGMVLMLGAELNAELERAQAEGGDQEAQKAVADRQRSPIVMMPHPRRSA